MRRASAALIPLAWALAGCPAAPSADAVDAAVGMSGSRDATVTDARASDATLTDVRASDVALDVSALDASATDASATDASATDADTRDAGADVITDRDAALPHVEARAGVLRVDGRPVFLYGGDLHYFRVRARDFDAPQTQAMWARSLDLMRAAGMNLVSTYIPWDYHAPRAGEWDFSGARDVGRFLRMACDRGMYVVAKPGPLITGEWPNGFGYFGAVPAWWKAANPGSLVRNGRGEIWSYGNGAAGHQPSYLDPAFLSATRAWYARVAQELRPFMGSCLVGVQIDNETNLYWGNRYGDVDYSPSALAHYRAWLADRYGSIGALNQRYSASYGSFAEVAPPTSAPGSSASERPRNPWYFDWYEAGQALCAEYLRRLRAMLEAEGIREPDVMFTVNDSPFTISVADFVARTVLLQDGLSKSRVASHSIDLYPRVAPLLFALQDDPFQADWFTRLYRAQAVGAGERSGYLFGAEIQGGIFAIPVLGRATVRPEATDQILARTIGRGLGGAAFYVVRDGINLDGSLYDYQAAIRVDGTTTPRYDVMARWGAALRSHGVALMRSTEVVDPVAVLANGRYAASQAGIADNNQRFTTIEYPALFGWLANAGINPGVLDARAVTLEDLRPYRAVFYPNPDYVDDATARLLRDYVAAGGTLIDTLWPGSVNEHFVPSDAVRTLSTSVIPGTAAGSWNWITPFRDGDINVRVAGLTGTVKSVWYEVFRNVSGVPAAEPFAWERNAIGGGNGRVVGFTVRDAGGARAFLGTSVYTRFNQDDYYRTELAELERAVSVARHLLGFANVTPTLETGRVRQLAWARRDGDTLFVFVVNDGEAAARVRVRARDLAPLGLTPTAQRRVVNALRPATPEARTTGAALLADGLEVDVPAASTALLVLSP